MRIAVNTRLLIKNKLGGIGFFACQTLRRITLDHPEHEFYFIFDRDWDEEFIFSDNIIPLKLGPPARHPFLWHIWFQYRLPRLLKKIKPDLFLSPDGFIPLKSPVPTLAAIHDINFYHFPQDLPFFVRKYYLKYFPLFGKQATKIATVSEYSKSDMIKNYHINPEKIDVVYNGVDIIFKPLIEEKQEEVRKRYSQGEPFFIFIGALVPRKNLPRLLKAFDLFKEKTKNGYKLIFIGDAMHSFREIDRTFSEMKFKKDVVFAGRIPREEIALLLASARALLFVSYFEGFGIPLIEAFCSGVPVVAGNRTSLPEIGGKGAFYVDPFSVESITEGMIKADQDLILRKNLILEGRKQKDKFTWERSAELLWKSIENTPLK
jgi:glycosyltransferase involved in cell wall biosynthesis